ncbi:MAG: hypothetical protein OQK82_01690 [Candidatus Pacearchaeota archaeon]|nr:hypothetical protein [Candidatus Pacearchaeota archaeon]
MKKQGISTIIATVIMILFVIVGSGIVWVVIQNLLSQESEDISSGLNRVSLSIVDSSVNITDSQVAFIINRNIGEGELSEIKILLYDEEGESYSENIDASTLDELGSKKVTVSKSNIANISKISIAPVILTESGSESIKGISDTYINS